PNLRVSDDDLLDFILRKAAHVGEYAVLAWLAWRSARSMHLARTRAAVNSWLFVFLYACSDEWHQTFVAGRVGHPRDVAIDVVGATLALGVAWARTRSAAASQEQTP